MTWQDVVAWLIVAGAVVFLLRRFGFARRRKPKAGSKKPDVPVSALTRKRPKR